MIGIWVSSWYEYLYVHGMDGRNEAIGTEIGQVEVEGDGGRGIGVVIRGELDGRFGRLWKHGGPGDSF